MSFGKGNMETSKVPPRFTKLAERATSIDSAANFKHGSALQVALAMAFDDCVLLLLLLQIRTQPHLGCFLAAAIAAVCSPLCIITLPNRFCAGL
jgi:hypothetical protein